MNGTQEVEEKKIEDNQTEEVQDISAVEDNQTESSEEVVEENLSKEQINWKQAREERARIKLEREQERVQREKKEQESAEKDVQINALTEALEKIASNRESGSISKKEEKQLISELIDDDIPTGGELKSFLKDFVPNAVKEILEKQKTEAVERKKVEEVQEIPQKLSRNHENFEQVVTEENIFYLKYHYPDIEATIAELPHSYDKWSRVYSIIKKLVPQGDSKAISAIDKNLSKPQNLQTTVDVRKGESGTSHRLSESEKAANYKKILALARSV